MGRPRSVAVLPGGGRPRFTKGRGVNHMDTLGSAVEVGVTIGVVLATVGIGQFYIRMFAARRLAINPQDANAGALLLMF